MYTEVSTYCQSSIDFLSKLGLFTSLNKSKSANEHLANQDDCYNCIAL